MRYWGESKGLPLFFLGGGVCGKKYPCPNPLHIVENGHRYIFSMSATQDWIYFLQLSRNLPREFLLIDQQMKSFNKSLVPVSLKGLIETASSNASVHIVIYIKTVTELSYFKRRVRKILKYLMRNSLVNIYIASSFSNINDGSLLKQNQYNFVKLPCLNSQFCESISKMVDSKDTELNHWPGGTRPKMAIGA